MQCQLRRFLTPLNALERSVAALSSHLCRAVLPKVLKGACTYTLTAVQVTNGLGSAIWWFPPQPLRLDLGFGQHPYRMPRRHTAHSRLSLWSPHLSLLQLSFFTGFTIQLAKNHSCLDTSVLNHFSRRLFTLGALADVPRLIQMVNPYEPSTSQSHKVMEHPTLENEQPKHESIATSKKPIHHSRMPVQAGGVRRLSSGEQVSSLPQPPSLVFSPAGSPPPSPQELRGSPEHNKEVEQSIRGQPGSSNLQTGGTTTEGRAAAFGSQSVQDWAQQRDQLFAYVDIVDRRSEGLRLKISKQKMHIGRSALQTIPLCQIRNRTNDRKPSRSRKTH